MHNTFPTMERAMMYAFNEGYAMGDTLLRERLEVLAFSDEWGSEFGAYCPDGMWPTPSGCVWMEEWTVVQGGDSTIFIMAVRPGVAGDKAVPMWLPHYHRTYTGGE